MNEEQFIINDIDFDISPSDVQVMDDNWVVEDSYLRSKAVYCFRSKYAATKVVLNIPFKIVTDLNADGVKLTKDCIRLITELSVYPYCFVKNSRIQSYISPTVVSNTGFMMFAVSELSINQDANVPDIIFLEVVLEYYNHGSMIADFSFKSNLGVYQGTDENGNYDVGIEADIPCEDLKSSDIWNQFIDTKENIVWNNLEDKLNWNLSGYVGDLTKSYNDSFNPLLNVGVAAPVIQIKVGMSEEIIQKIEQKDHKYILTTNVEAYNNGQFEQTYTGQDTANYSINSSGDIVTNPDDPGDNTTTEEINPKAMTKDDQDKLARSPGSGKSEKVIVWENLDMQSFGIQVSSIQVKLKNKLVSHQISSYKHPVIQYMGKYPAITNVTFSADVKNIYNDAETAPGHVFIKNLLSILDYNRQAYPECEAYNYLKIKSFGNILMNVMESLPGQSVTTATSANQTTDTVVYSFNEGNLSSFLDEVRINKSGKKSKTKHAANTKQIILSWLDIFTNNYKRDDFRPTSADMTALKTVSAMAVSASDDIGYKYDNIKEGLDVFSMYYKPTYRVPVSTVDPLDSGTYYIKKLDLGGDQGSIDGHMLITSTLPIIRNLIDLRFDLQLGKTINKPNITYNPNGLFELLSVSMLTTLDNTNKLHDESIKTSSSVEDSISEILDDDDSLFYGYNLDDLDYESLVPNYNMETDLVTAKINPFFFLTQTQLITGLELKTLYDSRYNIENMGNTYKIEDDLDELSHGDLGVKNQKERDMELNIHRISEIPISENPLTPSDNRNSNPLLGLPRDQPSYNDVLKGGYGSANPGNHKKVMSKENKDIINKVLDEKKASSEMKDFIFEMARKESNNGNGSMVSPTGAKGMFQILNGARLDAIKRNKSLDPKNYTGSADLMDTEYNTRIMYEYVQMLISNKNTSKYVTKKDGSFDPRVIYALYNQGPGGGNQIMNVLSGVKSSFSSNTLRNNILSNTTAKFKKGPLNTDAQIAEAYIKSVENDISDYGKANANIRELSNESRQNQLIENNNNANTKATSSRIGIAYKAKLAYVTDGDTFVVYLLNSDNPKAKHPLRIYGVDAPEVLHEVDGKELNEPEGQEAKKQMINLFNNSMSKYVGKDLTVYLKGYDTGHNRDVATVILPDGNDTAKFVLSNGLGIVPAGFVGGGEGYEQLEKQAKDNLLGIWGIANKYRVSPRSAKSDFYNMSDEDRKKGAANNKVILDGDVDNALNKEGVNQNSFIPVKDKSKATIITAFGRHPDPKDPTRLVDSDGIVFTVPEGTDIIAAADGDLNSGSSNSKAGGMGLFVEIDHKNGLKSTYAYLGSISNPTKDSVVQGEVIGKSGKGGKVLYMVSYKGVPLDPFKLKTIDTYKKSSEVNQELVDRGLINLQNKIDNPKDGKLVSGVTLENTVYNEDKLAYAIFDNINKYSTQGLSISLPAIRVYVTVGSENDTIFLSSNRGNSLYYELKGIKDFRLSCSNDKNPIDTCSMYVANPSHLNTDAYSALNRMPVYVADRAGTDQELAYINDRLQLRPGTKIHVRLGYGNDPNKLEPVFNGSVSEVDNSRSQTLGIVCTGYGKELVNDILSPNAPSYINDTNSNASTRIVIGRSMLSSCISHFGFLNGFVQDKLNQYSDNDPESKAMGEGKFSLSNSWGFTFMPNVYKARIYQNCFTEYIERVEDEFSNYWGWAGNLANIGFNKRGNYPFPIYRMTPWECMKQAEYRHPGTIVKPLLFEDRMTLFHGIKEQFYFYKDLSKALQISAAKGAEGSIETYFSKRTERMKPAVNIHVATSSTNIINNGICINSNYATSIATGYTTMADKDNIVKPWEQSTETISLDDNLMPWEIRTKQLYLSGCLGRYSAFLYGTTELKKECEKMYDGNIRLIGNPSIKSGDYIFINDADQRVIGLALIRECNHIFTEQHGYVTDIVPGQYVEAANFLHSDLWTKLALAIKAVTPKMMLYSNTNYSEDRFNTVLEYLTLLSTTGDALANIHDDESIGNRKTELGMHLAAASFNYFVAMGVAKLVFGQGYRASLLRFPMRGSARFLLNFAKAAFNSGYRQSLIEGLATRLPNASKAMGALFEAGDALRAATKAKVGATMTKVKDAKFAKDFSAAMDAMIEARKAKTGLLAKGLYKAGKFVFSNSAKGAIRAAYMFAKGMSGAGLMLMVTGGMASILLDVVIAMSSIYVLNAYEKESLTRQPLLLYPLVKNGKPYVGGMTGFLRNDYWDSLKTEFGKNMSSFNKALQNFRDSAYVNGSDSASAFASTAGSITNFFTPTAAKTQTRGVPLYSTGYDGKVLKDDRNRNLNNGGVTRFYTEEAQKIRNQQNKEGMD